MTSHDDRIRPAQPGRDREAAGAFTFRPMMRWQVWAISIAALAVLIGLLAYSGSL